MDTILTYIRLFCYLGLTLYFSLLFSLFHGRKGKGVPLPLSASLAVYCSVRAVTIIYDVINNSVPDFRELATIAILIVLLAAVSEWRGRHGN